ncbi:DUF1134 domain-containing protein [Rhizobium grahamii]|uniref:DUF1134 domain-containing protein n=1 Tax=Rhizobium grahamii TaxID=1120045 RepID=A0A5Q0C666_9HYPH|nr:MULTISPECIES: EipA family protein [Rhizobium]QFY60992.1 DUF1134 domain-containing protein [Rhizobium grahamii]QRM49858.1 DUF1134 domain-containing protein [Rhizobium sp. BG6]
MHSSIFGRFRALGRLILALTVASTMLSTTQASAQEANSGQYTMQEIVDAGHSFFGSTSGGLAKVIEAAFQKYGLPNGYILGQEGSGAFIAGLTYGEGQLNTKNAGEHPLYWQGPSLGIDYGGQGTRVMMLVYDLPSTDAIYARFGGVSGQAFVLAGFGMTLLKNNNVLIVPIRTGVGARLGLNVGYLKVTPSPTWNPF